MRRSRRRFGTLQAHSKAAQLAITCQTVGIRTWHPDGDLMNRSLLLALLAGCTLLFSQACSDGGSVRRGDLAKQGGSPTVRAPYDPSGDDPFTTNDESNDQSLGHFGTITVEITNHDSGNTYTLDAEVSGTILERVYFPKGGWIDFYSCEVGEELYGDCEDEDGRWWTLEGESQWGAADSFVDDEEADLTDGEFEDPLGAYDEYEEVDYQDDDSEDYLGTNGASDYTDEGGGYP